MNTVSLTVRYAIKTVQLDECIAFRFEKERYTPYTKLSGEWYCPSDTELKEILRYQLSVDGNIIHYGYATTAELLKRDGRTVLKFTSSGYSAALMANQCPDGLITDVNLQGIISKATFVLPNIRYQQDTPVANYVNYYEGTSLWDAIVAYSLRVGSHYYPYLSGYDLIRIEPTEEQYIHEITSDKLISRSNKSDYNHMISKITMKDVDGTPGSFLLTNGYATQRSIVRCREMNFDREWIMEPKAGIQHRLDYSMRAVNADSFSFFGYTPLDLLDRISVPDIGFEGEIHRITVSGSADKGIVTTVWCYHDCYSR